MRVFDTNNDESSTGSLTVEVTEGKTSMLSRQHLIISGWQGVG